MRKRSAAPETPLSAVRWALLIALDLFVTFQLTGHFLFTDPERTEVRPWQLLTFALCAVGVFFLLRAAIWVLRRWDAKGVFRAGPRRENKRENLSGRLIAGAVLVLFTGLSRGILPDFIAVTPRETTVTLRSADGGDVAVEAACAIDGAAAALPAADPTGDWTLQPDGVWTASEAGSTLTLTFPAAEDIDLRFLPSAEGGVLEIEDGDRLTRIDLRDESPYAPARVYRVRSGLVSGASDPLLWLLSLSIGAAYAAAARELFLTTARPVPDRRYRRALFLALTGIWLIYLTAANPGAMSPDSLSQLSQAIGLTPVTDAHPALLTLFYRLVWRLTGSAVWITLCQVLAYAAVTASFLARLAERGLSRHWLTAFALFFGLHIVNGIYSAVLWKDVPYTICLLWLTLLFWQMGEEREAFFTPGNVLQTAVCLALTLLLRHNGLIVLIAGCLALGTECLCRRTLRPLLTGLLAAVLVLAVRSGAFRALDVEPNAIYDPAEFLHGMAYAQIASGEEDPFLAQLAPEEVWREIYTPYNANSITMSGPSLENGIPEKVTALGRDAVLGAYLRAFVRHPFLILKDRLLGCNLLWNPVPSGYNYHVCGGRYENVVERNALGFYCRETFLTEWIARAFALTSDHLAPDAVVWRPGWCVAMALLLCWLALGEKKRGLLLAAVPMAANCLSLAMAMAWQDYRYVYFAFVCSLFLLLIYFVPREGERGTAAP
ncbi:MAG: hypothetical protein IJT62_01225 [Oscillospiraceae bacterium]|nr:hypothetical protein [Oscillospiraceae bacterium]